MSRTKISGDFFDVNLEKDSVHLVIADFPYGGIVKKEWDKNISAENYPVARKTPSFRTGI